MGFGTTVQPRQAERQNHPKIRDRQSAIDHAVRVIYRVCCLAGSPNLIDRVRADLEAEGVRAAMRKRDTAAVFDWLIAALSYQGISDQIAYDYMEQHGYVRWDDINQKLAQGATCPKLRSYWQFYGCDYTKLRRTCANPDHVSRCPLPTHDLRNGRLNQYTLRYQQVHTGDGKVTYAKCTSYSRRWCHRFSGNGSRFTRNLQRRQAEPGRIST